MEGFKKILDLIKKTGDRLIIWETESHTPYVVMNLDEYERLLQFNQESDDLSESEEREKINQDIAFWRSIEEEESREPSNNDVLGLEDLFPEKEETKEEDRYYFEPVES